MNLLKKGIIIRKAVAHDLAQIYFMGKDEPLLEGLHYELNPDNLADLFSSDASVCLCAARKKKILGFIAGVVVKGESRIHWIMVHPSFRRIGIGKRLLKLYMENSGEIGSDKYSVPAFRNNPEIISFFENNGFTVKNTFVELHRND